MRWCLLINLVGFCVGGAFALALFKSHDLDQVRVRPSPDPKLNPDPDPDPDPDLTLFKSHGLGKTTRLLPNACQPIPYP